MTIITGLYPHQHLVTGNDPPQGTDRREMLKHVRRAATPTLFLHGEADNDVPITQAEEMYAALKRRGVETVLVRYPREGHGATEPRHQLDQLERTVAWFDKYLQPKPQRPGD